MHCKYIWVTTTDNVLNNGTGCPKCSGVNDRSEKRTRKIIESLIGRKFPKAWPDFLRGRNGRKLSLDGYNTRHEIAFEYQGRQHYRAEPKWGGLKAFIAQKKRDARKRALCRNHGILLIVISYKRLKRGREAVEWMIMKKLKEIGLKPSDGKLVVCHASKEYRKAA
jgi:hypothetical protein